MINVKEFRKYAHNFVDWMADYFENIENHTVKSNVKPGEVYNRLPQNPPADGEAIEQIMKDFQEIILPGITHWQSPNFFAYFPANSSYPSVLAEMLTATLGAQCMIWETSPAAAELEEQMMNWLKQMLGLPEGWHGVIQDTASSANLCALITAREKYTGFKINETGFSGFENLRVYCSSETHSSTEKAVKIAGFGIKNLVKIKTDDKQRLDTIELEKKIKKDIANGFKPVCVMTTMGTTSTTAIDPIDEIAKICKAYDLWLHVDAAFAGNALILPEYRWMSKGIEHVDSFVFNPHKWMFTNFDCSAYFVKDKDALIRTFTILPEYLKTKTQGMVNDYRDWGIALGRRFRALKLWFVIRNFGVQGIQERFREHIKLAEELENKIKEDENFELTAQRTLNLVCFRFHPVSITDEEKLNKLNEILIHLLNDSGKLYLTHTKINGKYTIRFVVGQTYVSEMHVNSAWEFIISTAKKNGIIPNGNINNTF